MVLYLSVGDDRQRYIVFMHEVLKPFFNKNKKKRWQQMRNVLQ